MTPTDPRREAQEREFLDALDEYRRAGTVGGMATARTKAFRLYDEAREDARRVKQEALDAVPTTWLDPMLTGQNAVIGRYPYNGDDIEEVLKAVRQRIANITAASSTTDKGESNG